MVPEDSFGKKVFVYSGKKLDFNWEDAGLSLYFPDTNFEKEIEISIEIVTNIDEQSILPKHYRLMPAASAPYKITASAPLPAPVTVRMEHCAILEKEDSLVLMVAHKGPPYNFKLLPGAKFQLNLPYCEIKLEDFCILCSFWNLIRCRPMRLSVQIFYHEESEATFVVTKSLKWHVNTVQDKMTYVLLEPLRMICKSKTDAIKLSLPVCEKGWCITSNSQPAEIQKLDIDTYEPGEICPQLKLFMKWEGSGEPKEERVSIPITGGSITSFTLLCKPKPQPQVADISSRRQGDLGRTANIDTGDAAPIRQQVQQMFPTCQQEAGTLQVRAVADIHARPTIPLLQRFPTRSGGSIKIIQEIGINYHNLGIRLLNDGTCAVTNAIEAQYRPDVNRITETILQKWLQGPGREPKSWNTLITVLREIELKVLAQDIKDNLSQEEMDHTEYPALLK